MLSSARRNEARLGGRIFLGIEILFPSVNTKVLPKLVRLESGFSSTAEVSRADRRSSCLMLVRGRSCRYCHWSDTVSKSLLGSTKTVLPFFLDAPWSGSAIRFPSPFPPKKTEK